MCSKGSVQNVEKPGFETLLVKKKDFVRIKEYDPLIRMYDVRPVISTNSHHSTVSEDLKRSPVFILICQSYSLIFKYGIKVKCKSQCTKNGEN